MTDPALELGERPGCLKSALGTVALLLLAPAAAAVRSIARWRRGNRVIVRWTGEGFPSAASDARWRVDLELDVPPSKVAELRRMLTDTVVRIAELLRREDDVYHMAYRLPELQETVLVPVGPLLQELGERFALILDEGSLAGRTVVWPTLASERAVSELLDPSGYDPEAPGEPDRIMGHADIRWGLASSWAETGASVVHRVLLYLPAAAAPEIDRLLERLRASIS
jgi:hypothetical protein